MAFSVVMPALEMAQETGKLVAWRKKEGESVAKGEPLLEVETDKAVLEVEAPADGILSGITVHEGGVVPVGETIAWIVRPGEAAPDKNTRPAVSTSLADQEERSLQSKSAATQSVGESARLSPKARRLAKEQGIEIAQLSGSGPGGAILAADILGADKPGSAVQEFEIPHAVGRLMAERTTQSWASVPHFFVAREVDTSALSKARENWAGQNANTRITHTDLLVAIVARVLETHPRLNASWQEGKIRLNPDVNVAIAIAVEDGVVAAVIPKANRLDVTRIADCRRGIADRARAGRLHPQDLSGATFTISNLGMYEVDAFSAIINLPQAAILAVGSIKDRVIAMNGRPEVRPMMTLTLSCDHRVVDGAKAAAFLNDLIEKLREPENWLR